MFTSLTSAELRGWWQPLSVPHPVFVSVPSDAPHPQRRGLYVTRHPRPVGSEMIDGIRAASAAETLLALARDLNLLDLIILGDSAVHLGDCTLEQLSSAAAQRRRGAPRLRVAIPLLDGRSESPWESVLRLLHISADVEVESQKKIYDEWGHFVARADLWVVGTRRVHEYDGEAHRGRDVHRSDLARERRLVEINWQRVDSHHHSCSTKVVRLSLAWIACLVASGTRADWRDGRHCFAIRCSDRADVPRY